MRTMGLLELEIAGTSISKWKLLNVPGNIFMNDKGKVTVSEYEFHPRLDAYLADCNWVYKSSSAITIPPPPSRVNRAHRKDLYNLSKSQNFIKWFYEIRKKQQQINSRTPPLSAYMPHSDLRSAALKIVRPHSIFTLFPVAYMI
ncbi:hypothetical protein ACTXT7_017189 [Hymenolepis weldensis]